MINYLHVLCCKNKNCGKSIFLFSIYLQSTMNLNLPTPLTCQMMMDLNNHLQCHLAPNFTSHITRTRSTRKQKSTFFTFDLCSSTTNEYYKTNNPASEPHPFYFNHPLSLSYPHLTPILTLVFEFQNPEFKCKFQTQMSNPSTFNFNLSNSRIQPMQ